MLAWNTIVYGSTLLQWAQALGLALALLALLLIARHLLARRYAADPPDHSSLPRQTMRLLVARTRLYFLVGLAVYAASWWLALDAAAHLWLTTALFVVVLLQAGLWGSDLIGWWEQRRLAEQLGVSPQQVNSLGVLGLVGRLVWWSAVVLLILDNLPGVEITTLVASLGIGGIAIALAVQSILGDLFASLTIALDKPFVIGDGITVDEFSGTVESIGLKSTRIRSYSGEQIIFSNADLLNSRIRNFQRLQRRRVITALTPAYDSPPAALAALPDALRQIVSAHPQATFDRAHLKAFSELGPQVELIYYIEANDSATWLDAQHVINLAIIEYFHANQLSFAEAPLANRRN